MKNSGIPIFGEEVLTAKLISEMMPLLSAHWSEVAHYQDIPLAPNFTEYLKCAEAGIIRCYTVRLGGRLVGYSIFFVRPNMHYRESLQAVQDILFVLDECRGSIGARLVRYSDEHLRRIGVQAVYHHVKAAHDFSRLLVRQGYELVDLIYAKRLDQEKN